MNFNLIADRKEACIDYNDELDDEEGKAKNDDFEEDDEPDFMDNSGKCWEFGSKIVDEKHLKEWCQNKMGGMIVGKEEKLTRQFHCQIKQCQFKAIFLKSFSIVYTRNKHNHGIENGKNNQRKKEEKKNQISSLGRDYVDHFGKTWTFHAQIEKNIPHDKLLAKFGFTRIHNIRKTTLNLRCTISNQTGGMCPFSGIYLKSNGFLYIRGEHEHTKRMKIPQNIGDDYVDREGKIWKFNSEIGKNIKRKIFLTKFGFNNTLKKGSRFNMNCLKKGPNGTCKFAGIYLISNGCLYTRGKHSVHIEKNTKPNVGDDYVDHLGQLWPFHSKIDKKDISKEIFRNKFGFATFQRKERGFNLYCKKEMTNGGKCQFSGIYLNSNECLYIRGKHQHKSD